MRGGKREGAGRKAADTLPREVDITGRVGKAEYDMLLRMGNGQVTVGLRAALRKLLLLELVPTKPAMKSISRKLPVREVVPDFGPEGIRYNITTRLRLEREAAAKYEAAMLLYEKGL